MWTTSSTRILISLFTFVCFISFDVAANGSASNNDPDTIANYSNGNFIDNKPSSKNQDNGASSHIGITTNEEVTDRPKKQDVTSVLKTAYQELDASKLIKESSTSVKTPTTISATSTPISSTSATSIPTANTSATFTPPVTTSATSASPSTSDTSTSASSTSATSTSLSSTSATSTSSTSATSTSLSSTSATSTSASSTSATSTSPSSTSATSTSLSSTSATSTSPSSTSATSTSPSSTSATSTSPSSTSATSTSPSSTSATSTSPSSTSATSTSLSSTSATTTSPSSTSATSTSPSSTSATSASPSSTSATSTSASSTSATSTSASSTSATSTPPAINTKSPSSTSATSIPPTTSIATTESPTITSATTGSSFTSATTPLPIITTTEQLITTNESTSRTTEVFTRAIQAAETANNTSAIVGGVIGCILGLAAIAASVVFIFYFKRRSSQPRSRLSSPLVELDKKAQDYILEHRPIKILEFKEQVKRLHKDSNLLFQDDFEDIKKLSSRLPYTSNDAKKEGNKAKNRYSNILPYDHSRVKLLFQMEDDETMDYINANYIPGYNSVREYIATQGPLKSTLSDFWRMLWEQNSHVIVMLSDLYENQKPKVELYWPENLGEPTRYDNFTVELTNFSQFNSIIIRTFRISKGTEVRKVVHFFIVWSDFDADLEVRDFLDLVQVVRMEAATKKSGPIIVHCSAGVGRTGTFIALDYFMQYIEKHSLQDSIDVFSYVMKMRNNRVSMVQAEVQYIFIHDVLVEVIDKKIKLEEGQMNQHIYYNEDDHAKNDETVYVNMNELTNMKTGQENKAYEHDNDKDEESISV